MAPELLDVGTSTTRHPIDTRRAVFPDYERSRFGFEIFDAVSGRTLTYAPFQWTARVICWLIEL